MRLCCHWLLHFWLKSHFVQCYCYPCSDCPLCPKGVLYIYLLWNLIMTWESSLCLIGCECRQLCLSWHFARRDCGYLALVRIVLGGFVWFSDCWCCNLRDCSIVTGTSSSVTFPSIRQRYRFRLPSGWWTLRGYRLGTGPLGVWVGWDLTPGRSCSRNLGSSTCSSSISASVARASWCNRPSGHFATSATYCWT